MHTYIGVPTYRRTSPIYMEGNATTVWEVLLQSSRRLQPPGVTCPQCFLYLSNFYLFSYLFVLYYLFIDLFIYYLFIYLFVYIINHYTINLGLCWYVGMGWLSTGLKPSPSKPPIYLPILICVVSLFSHTS